MQALQALKGVGPIVATTILAEVGDFSRGRSRQRAAADERRVAPVILDPFARLAWRQRGRASTRARTLCRSSPLSRVDVERCSRMIQPRRRTRRHHVDAPDSPDMLCPTCSIRWRERDVELREELSTP
ncbi:transposase [Bradyrhizobium arachidis]